MYSSAKPVKETKRTCNNSTCLEELERQETLAGMQDIRETAATGTAGIIAATLETSMDRVLREIVRAVMRFFTLRFLSTNVLLAVVIL